MIDNSPAPYPLLSLMKAWLMDDFTGIKQLRLGDAQEPVAHEGEAVLEVEYAALNPADRYLAERQYPARPKLPHILGRDGIGTVTNPGTEAKDLRAGDRRVVLRGDTGIDLPGTFAERVAVPRQNLVTAPTNWSNEDGVLPLP